MAIAIRGSANTANGADGSAGIVLTKPTGVVANDVLLAFFHVDAQATTISGVPSGWALIPNIDSGVGISNARMWGYYLVAGGGEG